MADFIPRTVLLREIEGVGRVEYNGMRATIAGRDAGLITLAEIGANPHHFLSDFVARNAARIAADRVVAIVLGKIHGKSAQVLITHDQFEAGGRIELDRYRAWEAGVVARRAERQEAERAHDLAYNEGAEGYNPHRFGDSPTYRGR